MADQKITALPNYTNPDRVNDVIPIVSIAGQSTQKITINNLLGITSLPVGINDTQTLTNKTLTAPAVNSPVLGGTITGTYTFAGTPTFPATIVTTTGTQTLTNKTLTSPTINAPTITQASITADAISGFTTSNSGTIYGIPVTGGTMSGANLTNSTVTPSKLNTGAVTSTIVATGENTASTTYTDLATTTDQVTAFIGANGLALVLLTVTMFSAQTYCSFAISGATTRAASDNTSLLMSNVTAGFAGTFLVTGLAAGSTTFKMKYRVSSGTGGYSNRLISVVPL